MTNGVSSFLSELSTFTLPYLGLAQPCLPYLRCLSYGPYRPSTISNPDRLLHSYWLESALSTACIDFGTGKSYIYKIPG